jgi:hypothetical protein
MLPPEPATSVAAVAVSATGLTILGISTGLQPDILLAGFAGGLWALTYQPPAPLLRRAAATLGSAVVAGYLSPIAVAVLRSALPGDPSREIAQTAFGLLIGLISQRVIGPAVLRIADRKAREYDDGN